MSPAYLEVEQPHMLGSQTTELVVTLSEQAWADVVARGQTRREEVGIDELDRVLRRYGSYCVLSRFREADSFRDPEVRHLVRTLMIRFSRPVDFLALRRELLRLDVVERVGIPVARFAPA